MYKLQFSVNSQTRTVATTNRRGSTLLIVVALLGIMAFLGLTFYTFAKQERQSAVNFSQGAQTLKAPSIEPDTLFDFALQQVIIGPIDANYQSILWGGRHSMLANMFGRDGIPFNGEGVNVITDPITLGLPRVDMNFDGYNPSSPEAVDNQYLLNFVDSPAANAGTWGSGSGSIFFGTNKRFRGTGGLLNNTLDLPEPDVNYNSPDINSLFLSYDGAAYYPNSANQSQPTATRAIIPSYLRPQNLRYQHSGSTNALPLNALQTLNGGQGWYCSDGSQGTYSTASQVMRPHPQHYCVDGSGNVLQLSGTNIPRYTTSSDYQALHLRRPFTYSTYGSQNYYAPDTTYGNPLFGPSAASNAGNLGIWTGLQSADQLANNTTDLVQNYNGVESPYPVYQYQQHLDTDTDGDGVLDAILMDLGYPPVRRGDGKLVVPLFAISIRDLNGLVNVNADGNLAGNVNLSGNNSLSSINTTMPTSPTATPTTQFGYQAAMGMNSPTYPYLPDNLSKSNLGLSTSEVNPTRVLTADPTYNTNNAAYTDQALVTSEAAAQIGYFLKIFDATVLPTVSFPSNRPVPGRSIAELANLEWLFLNIGRPNFNLGYLTTWFQNQFSSPSHPTVAQQSFAIVTAVTDLYSGRNGESKQATFVSPSNSNSLLTYNNANGLPPAVFNGAPAVPTFASQIISYVSQQYTNGAGVTVWPGTANVINNMTNHYNAYAVHSYDVPSANFAKFFTTQQLGNSLDQPLSLYDLPKPGLSTTWMPPTSGVTAVEQPVSWQPAQSQATWSPQTIGVQSDDNTNYNEGEPYVPQTTGATASSIQWMTPLDFRGSGQHFRRYSWGADGQPGFANWDDDGDGIVDNFTEEGWPGSDDTYTSGSSTYFVHYGKYPNLTLTQTPTPPPSGSPPAATPSQPWQPSLSSAYFPTFSGYHSFYSGSNPFSAALTSGADLATIQTGATGASSLVTGGIRWGDYQASAAYFFAPQTQSSIPNPLTQQSVLMRGSVWNSLFDEPAETIVDPTIMSPAVANYLSIMTSGTSAPLAANSVAGLLNSVANDSTLGPEEMLFLQGTGLDARLTEDRSRLAELMPANLVASQSAADIRKRLTTVSSDRREFGAGSSAVGGTRAWECWPLFTNQVSPSFVMQQQSFLFPPSRYTVTGTSHAVTSLIDPYRPELFLFLQQFNSPLQYSPTQPYSYTAPYTPSSIPTSSQSLKLNVNRFLFLDYVTQNQYGFAPLPVQTSVQDLNATQARQNMARDLYTLLYTMCFVHTSTDATNPTTIYVDADYRLPSQSDSGAPYINVPTRAQAKEMAQFAVNLVDALDTDNIITAFYYDPDLTNTVTVNGSTTINAAGWDPAAFIGPDQVPQTSDDYVVYGVERQQLVISEASIFQIAQNTSGTNYTTMTKARNFVYFELQNVTPQDVTLAQYQYSDPGTGAGAPAAPTTVSSTNVTTHGNWRIRLSDPTQSPTGAGAYNLLTLASTAAGPTGQYNAVYLLPGMDSTNYFESRGANPTTDLVLPSGSTFTVSSGDGTGSEVVSDLWQGSGGLIVPVTPPDQTNPNSNKNTAPQCNLDLVYNYSNKSSRYYVQAGTGSGAFASQLPAINAPVRLTLDANSAAGPNPLPSDVRFNNWKPNTWAAVDSTANYSQVNANAASNNVNDLLVLQINSIPGNTTPPNNTSALLCSFPRTVPLLSGTAPAPTNTNASAKVNNLNAPVLISNPNPNASYVNAGNPTSPLKNTTASTYAPSTDTYDQIALAQQEIIQRQIAWQLQFDRDFASLSELLQLPMYGPDMLTSALAQVINPGSLAVVSPGTIAGITPGVVGVTPSKWPDISTSEFYAVKAYNTTDSKTETNYYPSIAAGRFLRPENPDYTVNAKLNTTPPTPTTNNGNRWYRLFNFLEVPSRFNQHVAVTGQPPLSMSNPPVVSLTSPPTSVTPAVMFDGAAASGIGTYTSFANPGTPGSTSLSYIQNSANFNSPFCLPQYFGWPRVHGQLNLNMIRHPQVLLALLDDDQMMYDPRFYLYQYPTYCVSNFPPAAPPASVNVVTPFLDSVDPDDHINRQWWLQFIVARDSRFSTNSSLSYQADPVTGYFVPGTPTARPFKGLDSVGAVAYNTNYVSPVGTTTVTPTLTQPQDSPLEDTILRALPYDSLNTSPSATLSQHQNDASPTAARRLFEVGSFNEHFDLIGANPTVTSTSTQTIPDPGTDVTTAYPLHSSARHRLLSKLMNNTTTRSNSFAVYITVQYHEAAQVTSDSGVTATRIGGLLDDAPVHRGFFVIDRTGAVEQMKTLATNAYSANAACAAASVAQPYAASFPVSTGSYSFQANTDTTGVRYFNSANYSTASPTTGFQNGIRWKDLVLYRRTLN